MTLEAPVELSDRQIWAAKRYLHKRVVDACREWSERFPWEPELGLTREKLCADLFAAAVAARLVHDSELGELAGCEVHCIRLYHRVPGWLRLEADWLVCRFVNRRAAELEVKT